MKTTGQWHFKLAPSKIKVILTRSWRKNDIKVRGETAYRSDINVGMFVTKKNCSLYNLSPDVIIGDNLKKISPKKIKDVVDLLKIHNGNNWEDNQNLKYFKDVVCRGEGGNPDIDENQIADDPNCEFVLEECDDLRV